jgi:integrase
LKFLDESGIKSLEDVTPMTISAFGKWGRENGSPNLLSQVSHLSTFYNWRIMTGLRTKANPVISSVHAGRKRKRLPRPFSDETLALIWKCLDSRGNSRLRAQAAIAEESGMRRGEIINIRLSDIDLERYEIFVRLPNKTNREHTARFREKTKTLVSLWLKDRDPECGHDYLFHNTEGNPCKKLQIHLEFVNVLCKSLRGRKLHDEGLDSWSMHRMRHTMATKLAKGGASCSTIMGVVGWSSYSAMVGYVGIDEEDKERGYTEAMERADEKDAHQPESQVLTLAEVFERTRKCEIAA